MTALALCNTAVTGCTSHSLPHMTLGSWASSRPTLSSLPEHSNPHPQPQMPPVYRGLTFATSALASLSWRSITRSSTACLPLRYLRVTSNAGSCHCERSNQCFASQHPLFTDTFSLFLPPLSSFAPLISLIFILTWCVSSHPQSFSFLVSNNQTVLNSYYIHSARH